MARPREFDPETVIAAAADVFWMHGYDGASLPDLLAGTGLSRGSLYKAYSGKQSLFIEALQHYADKQVWPAVELLKTRDDLSGLDRIETVFGFVPASIQAGDSRGCLLCTAAGYATADPEIEEVITELLNALQDGFATALETAGKPDNGLAHLLMAHYVGLRTLQRSGATETQISKSVEALGRMLRE